MTDPPELIRPYDRRGHGGVITPSDVHHWIAEAHTEIEWQGRERVLTDQHRDAQEDARRAGRLAGLGFWVAFYMAVLAVLAFSLTSHIPDAGAGHIGPWWVVIVGVVAVTLTGAGFVAAWMGLTDYSSAKVGGRIAERALREHHVGYANRG